MKDLNEKTQNEFRLGVHTSIAGGISKAIERAASLGCNTMQIFSHSPRQWRKSAIFEEEIARFKILRKKYDIHPVFIHASYLINLASHSSEIQNKSIDLLSYELENADKLGAEYVVLHTGSASGEDGNRARKRAAKAILKSLKGKKFKARLLLENTSGQRGDITSSVATLAEIIDTCHSVAISGICIDTCHAFTSGYDITSAKGTEQLVSEIKGHIGLDKLGLIHVNDSRRPLASGVDRHEHIGKGFIGTRGFKRFLSDHRISTVPMVLETPKQSETDDRKNLNLINWILSGR